MMETEAAVQNETKASSGKKIIKLSGKLKPKELSYIVKLGTGLALASLVVMIGLAVFLFWGPDLIAQTTTFVRVLLITFAFLFVVSVLSVFNPLLHSIILQRSQVAEAKFEVQDIIREQIALQQQIKVLQEKNKEIEAMVQILGLAETGQRKKLPAVSMDYIRQRYQHDESYKRKTGPIPQGERPRRKMDSRKTMKHKIASVRKKVAK